MHLRYPEIRRNDEVIVRYLLGILIKRTLVRLEDHVFLVATVN